MAHQYGFSSLFSSEKKSESFNPKTPPLLAARVKDIILSDTHPLFEPLGEWQSIGYIEFEVVDYQVGDTKIKPIAKPFFPNSKNYPLVNEIVLILQLPNNLISQETSQQSYYYLNPINLWNHPHHNASPNQFQKSTNQTNKSYQDIEGGSTQKELPQEEGINLNSPKVGGTFSEKSNISPLLPFDGDVIWEGRFGNSIRFGSTNKDRNPWSTSGENGNPITILSNGQTLTANSEGWIPRVEDIDKDLSSIYLTSNQKIPIQNINDNYSSFKSPPIHPREYNSNQIILNSKRVILNSNEDDILLSSKKHIGLSSDKDIGMNSKTNVTFDTPTVNLGSKDANESVILGDKFMVQFRELLQSLINISSALENLNDWPGGSAVPNPLIPPVAKNVKNIIQNFQNLVKDKSKPLLSKVSKTV